MITSLYDKIRNMKLINLYTLFLFLYQENLFQSKINKQFCSLNVAYFENKFQFAKLHVVSLYLINKLD